MSGGSVRPAEFRFTAPDLRRLLAHSVRLRAFMRMLARNPARVADPAAHVRFLRLCNGIRLDLRVSVDLPPGCMLPVNDRAALRYMQRPQFCDTAHMRRVQAFADRRRADPRLLVAVDRLVWDALAVDVPLFPAALDYGDEVHIGHAVERHLPWSCWDLVERMAVEAGHATGFPLIAARTVPGHFKLSGDAPEMRGDEIFLRAKRLSEDEARAERDRVLSGLFGGAYV